MFFNRRSLQAEYFDTERPIEELQDFFRSLGFFNRFFAFGHPFEHWVPHLMGVQGCRSLSILDVGAGNGSLGKTLSRWAKEQRWHWQVTNLDTCWAALSLNPQGRNVAGSAIALPFKDASFDVVIASQMAHHLDDTQAEQLLRESWRVARQLLVVSDLHRNALLYLTLWVICHLRRDAPSFRADALLSVKRGWRARDLQHLAAKAGLPSANITVQFLARVVLCATK